jgi:hypothetical protein
MTPPDEHPNHVTIQDLRYNSNYLSTIQLTGNVITNRNSLTIVPAICDDEPVQVTKLPTPNLNGGETDEATILLSYPKWLLAQRAMHNDSKVQTDVTSVGVNSGMSIPYTQIQHTHIKNKVRGYESESDYPDIVKNNTKNHEHHRIHQILVQVCI